MAKIKIQVQDLKNGETFTCRGQDNITFIKVGSSDCKYCVQDDFSRVCWVGNEEYVVVDRKLVFGDLKPGQRFRYIKDKEIFTKLKNGCVLNSSWESLQGDIKGEVELVD